jgi:transposase
LFLEQDFHSMKGTQQPLLPFPEPLFVCALNPLFSCNCESLGVKCPHTFEKQKAPPVAQTTDEADQPNAIAHIEAESTPIVPQSVGRKQEGTMEARELRGLEIASSLEIKREGNVWVVPSQSKPKQYTVNLFLQTCTCLDFDAHRIKCKHIYAAEAALRKESGLEVPTPDPEKKARRTYKQDWKAYNAAQKNEKPKFQLLLHELCKGIEEPLQKKGRGRPRLPLADMIFAAAFRVYSTISCRRFSSDLTEAHAKGYLTRIPSPNSIFDYFQMKILTPYLRQLIEESSRPLSGIETDFAVDSSGFSTNRYARWVETKYGKGKVINKKDWIKVHIMCGVKTNIVTAVELSGPNAGDSPRFKPLVLATSNNFVMNEVSADKAYSAEDNLKLVQSKSAMPYIDFRSNATAGNRRSGSTWKRMYNFYQYNQEWFYEHYHKRSNVESTFSMIKAKFGGSLRSKTRTAQYNEALCKILCHNICVVIQSIYELGIEPTFWVED